jgi:GntR family transcriptional regulator
MLWILMSVHDMPGKSVSVAPGAGVPLHRQLFLVLHDEIARGAIAPGDPLPTEQTLCEQFGVSRITVRRALADLADQGYIERRQGVGSFVRRHDRVTQQPGSGSYLDGLRQAQFETEAEVLEFDRRVPPRAVTDKVAFAGDALHVLRLRRERRTAEPLMVTEAWLPAGLADVIDEDTLVRNPLYSVLAGAGIDIDRVETEITAEIAGPRAAQLLDTAIGAALLRVHRVAYAAGAAHHFLSILLSPDRSRILMSLSAEELQSADGAVIAHDVRRETDR